MLVPTKFSQGPVRTLILGTPQDVLKQIGLELYNPTLEKRVLEVVNSRQCPKTWSLWLNDIFPNLHAGVAEADAAGAAKDAHKGPKITDKAGNFVSFNDAKTLLMRVSRWHPRSDALLLYHSKALSRSKQIFALVPRSPHICSIVGVHSFISIRALQPT